MIWETLRDPALGCSSYLIGDESVGEGMVVDALGALGYAAYVLAAQEAGLEIKWVVETHVHADHASSAGALAAAGGVPVSLSHEARPEFPSQALRDGDEVVLGAVRVTVWETPGHTPDSLSLVVRDLNRSEDPWLVMSGDSLFVGDVGRPDLADADPDRTLQAAHDQFRSVGRLMTLPDYTEVHPAHYGSSPCGGLFMSKKPSSTIGFERHTNPMLRIEDPDEFARYQLTLLKPPPLEAARLREANLGRRGADTPEMGAPLALNPLATLTRKKERHEHFS